MKKIDVLISLTSIPRRLSGSLFEVLAALKRQSLKCKILISIPVSYRKWGPVGSIPDGLQNLEDVIIYSPTTDYGPATKLLGALEYVKNRPEITHIITVDDDVLIDDANYLEYLAEHATVFPNYAVTIGGIKLAKFPFKHGDGLIYGNKFIFVDVPAGYKAVLYPTKPLRASKLPFQFFDMLPPGAVNDDDAYFGVVLSVLNIPLFAIPGRRGGVKLRTSSQEGGSAVTELVDKDRTKNEMEIFQYAFKQGYFRHSMSNANRLLNLAQRFGLARIYVKGLFGSPLSSASDKSF